MKTCAIIPAAGLGSRLGIEVPKILAPLTSTETVWTILRRKLLAVVDHIHVVVSPQAITLMRDAIGDDLQISVSVQEKPIGMGDAIFGAVSFWEQAETILVVWGDQVFVSKKTLTAALALKAPQTLVIPLTQMISPYVEYIFQDTQLLAIKQSREGDMCSQEGLADVGTFVMSTQGLLEKWKQYTRTMTYGKQTAEINFLPFLPFLSAQKWDIKHILVDDVREARGINTPDDLIFFQNLFTENSICEF